MHDADLEKVFNWLAGLPPVSHTTAAHTLKR